MEKIRKSVLFFLLMMLFLAGCGNDKAGDIVTGRYYAPESEKETLLQAQQEDENTATENTKDTKDDSITTDLFLITNNDMQSECLVLEQLASGKQYMYYYSITTRFFDKYGNRTNVSCLEPGRVITIGKKDTQGRLLEAQISDRVWEYPDVVKYAIDEEKGIFEIAGTRYSFDDGLYVNSDGNPEQLEKLTDIDVLRIVGIGKKILSVSVTTGHGELQLTNTKLFEGSFIQVGSKIFAEVTPDMSMEIPEGTYTVAVANKGYGGSTEIEVKRGQKITLDLDTLKGEGPKTGNVLFAIDVAGATLQIDGKVIDYSQPVELQYGVHTLAVTADSYESYNKRLYVNSKEATIVISLTGEDVIETNTSENTNSTDDSESTNSTNDAASAGSLAGSKAGTKNTESSSSSANSNIDEAQLNSIINELLDEKEDSSSDYLSTLSEVLSALTRNSSD